MKSKTKAQLEHEKFVEQITRRARTYSQNFHNQFPVLGTGKPGLAPLSNNIYVAGGFKQSIDDYKWRRGLTESKETIKAIEAKKKQSQPLYNKGAYQYITPDVDLTTMGKKV